jgi:hypothetical protein
MADSHADGGRGGCGGLREPTSVGICVGAPPYVFNGSENSSGYTHELTVDDPSIIGNRKVWGRRPGAQLCGASTEFSLEFWALSPGSTKATIRFGRLWDESTMEVKADLLFVVPEVDDAKVTAAVAEAEHQLATAQAAMSAKGISLNAEEDQASLVRLSSLGSCSSALSFQSSTETGGQRSAPGHQLLALATDLGRCTELLASAAQRDQHALDLSAIADSLSLLAPEEAGLMAQVAKLKAAEESMRLVLPVRLTHGTHQACTPGRHLAIYRA